MTGWVQLDRFLQTDPADVGCDRAIAVLHLYAEYVAGSRTGHPRSLEDSARYAGVAAHLAACGPCGQDFDGLLAAIQSSRGPA